MRHDFLFGCGAFDFIPYVKDGDEEHKEIVESWQKIFNYGTLPFYWGRYEPVEGEPDRDSLMKTAEYMKSKGDYLVSVDGTEQKMTLVQDWEKVIEI